ncbi:MAG: glycosyltransferase family A protein, partial [Candidatus Margulisiibacteriota bacterium]
MKPWITIVVVAYQRYLSLPIIIHSFLTQNEPNWKMVILHDGPDKKHQSIAQPYLDQYPNIEYYQSPKRFNDWGHSLRQWAIEDLIDTPWMLLTNDDNYYVP